MIPESHLLFQDDPSVFNELTKMSALPNFRSNITIQREEAERKQLNKGRSHSSDLEL